MSPGFNASLDHVNNTTCFRPPFRVLPAPTNGDQLLRWMYIVVACASAGLAATAATAEEAPCDGFSFTGPPFVSPRIVQDLEPWMSDRGEQVVAINLPGSADSNRYSGEITTVQRDKRLPPTVVHKDGEASFSYRLIGRTSAGVYVLRTAANGGGSGTFQNLLLVTLSSDDGFSYDRDKGNLTAGRQRCLIKRMEAVPLGDRYNGEVSLDGNKLHIGADANPRGAGLFPDNVEMIVPAPSSD